MSKIKLIVAVSENGIIGNKGEIPWRLPEEMKHFKNTTMGHTVVMGHKTWLSLLPFNKQGYLTGRDNIVLSNDTNKVEALTKQYNDIPPLQFYDGSFDIVKQKKLSEVLGINSDIFIIGGSQIYNKYLAEDVVDEIILTKIKMKVNGDASFPNLSPENWLRLSVEENKYFDIIHYQRYRK
jgi:dihydrofolate reductase